jgi:hypothetical protein
MGTMQSFGLAMGFAREGLIAVYITIMNVYTILMIFRGVTRGISVVSSRFINRLTLL